MLKIKLLKALNGDSIIISYGEEKTYNILIDGGCGKLCYRQLCRYMEDMKKEKNIIDLVVLTWSGAKYNPAWLIANVQMGYEWDITHVIKEFTEILEPANPHKHWVCKNLLKILALTS